MFAPFLSHRPRLQPPRVVDQLAQAALGQAEIPRKPHRPAWLAANDANLHFEARRKLTTLDKGGGHPLFG